MSISTSALIESRIKFRDKAEKIIKEAEAKGLSSLNKKQYEEFTQAIEMYKGMGALIDEDKKAERNIQFDPSRHIPILGNAEEHEPWFAHAAMTAYTGKEVRGTTTTSGAGVIDQDVISQEFERYLANANDLAAAGARIMTVKDSTKWPLVSGIASGSFVAEATQSSEDTGTVISSRTIALKTMRVGPILVSKEFLDDGGQLALRVIDNSISVAVSDKMISTVFVGNGSSEPQGLTGTSGVNLIASGGALSDYDKFIDGLTKMGYDNLRGIDRVSIFTGWNTWSQLAKLQDLDSNYRVRPQVLDRVRFFTTNAIAASGGSETAYMGDWSNCIIGIRGPIRLTLEERWSDFLQTGFMAYLRMDQVFRHPGHFATITGITTVAPTT